MTLVERFHLSTGYVEIQYPSDMNANDLQDFEEMIAILIRSLKRRVAERSPHPSAEGFHHE